MEQAVKAEQGIPSYTKKIGQTTFRVNVYFAEDTTVTFEDKLLHLMANDIVTNGLCTKEAEQQSEII
ncbi:hypothetical protein DWX94_13995 [Coprococcus eutactus]|uniref:Transposon-encoded protein TnpW n=1 Tax=Coprococcus eutactus TaxID=33043 RepID=A0A3R5YS53_9FIRM|nr:hypothetical protein DWX94_13995 [Coprococcus eutactus]